METKNTIPTNHGNQTIDQIMDRLAYSSYVSTRNAGGKPEVLKKWYANAEAFEKTYQIGLIRINN